MTRGGVQDKKQQQLAALDAQYQAKIMGEVERYQTLLQEKELLNQKWDEQNATLVEAHEKVVHEITEELEAKLLEEQMHFNQLQEEKEEQIREFEEVKRQLEEDADRCAPTVGGLLGSKWVTWEQVGNMGVTGGHGSDWVQHNLEAAWEHQLKASRAYQKDAVNCCFLFADSALPFRWYHVGEE